MKGKAVDSNQHFSSHLVTSFDNLLVFLLLRAKKREGGECECDSARESRKGTLRTHLRGRTCEVPGPLRGSRWTFWRDFAWRGTPRAGCGPSSTFGRRTQTSASSATRRTSCWTADAGRCCWATPSTAPLSSLQWSSTKKSKKKRNENEVSFLSFKKGEREGERDGEES